MDAERGMPNRHRAVIAIGVLAVAIVIVAAVALLGFLPPGPRPPSSLYSLSTKVYAAAISPQSPTATLSASGLEGPLVIGANTTGVGVHATLTVGGEIVFEADFTDMTYVYPYATAVAGAPNVLLVIHLPSGAAATAVTIQLALRTDLASNPATGGSAMPSHAAPSLVYPPFDAGLMPSPDGPVRHVADWTWNAPQDSTTCFGFPATVRGPFWFNLTVSQTTSFGLGVVPGWSMGGGFDMKLSGNVTFHAHAPAGEPVAMEWSVCKPSSAGAITANVDGG